MRAAAAAEEEEMPMKQALRQAQADFDVLKGEIDAEDGACRAWLMGGMNGWWRVVSVL